MAVGEGIESLQVRHILFVAVASALTWTSPSAVWAAKLRVCAKGCPYSSIQSAIDAAKTDDTIRIEAGTYSEILRIGFGAAAKNLKLQGTAAKQTVVDGAQQDCVLAINKGYTVSIERMTFTNGGNCLNGGGILSDGTLALTDVTVTNSEAEQFGGGILNDADGKLTMLRSTVSGNKSPAPTLGRGGGIYNAGIASLTDCIFTGNIAAEYGSGIENIGTLVATRSQFINNGSPDGSGGGIASNHVLADRPSVTVTDSVISGNTAGEGGGVYNFDGTFSLTKTRIRDNTAITGGGLDNSVGGTMLLKKSPITDNHASNGCGLENNGGTLTLTNSPVKGNQPTADPSGYGGGLVIFGGTVNLNRSPVSRNSIGISGGGIAVLDDGELTLTSSRVFDNTAATSGGGIYLSIGTVDLRSSRVTDNQPNNCVNVPGC